LSSFLSIANSRGHASHLYKDYYGVFPRMLKDNSSLSTPEFLEIAKQFKTAKNIRYAKRQNA